MKGLLPFLNGMPVGHYRIAVPTGLTTGLSANAPIFSMRWGGTNNVRALITRLEVLGTLVTPFTGAQEVTVAAYYARTWSVADSGGTSVTLTTPFNQLNSLADVAPSCTINVATTGALTAGTRTLDSNAIVYVSGAQTLAAATAAPLSIYDQFEIISADAQFPMNFQNGNAPATGLGVNNGPEGFVVTVPVAQGAGGTVRYVIEVDWVEYHTLTNVN